MINLIKSFKKSREIKFYRKEALRLCLESFEDLKRGDNALSLAKSRVSADYMRKADALEFGD